MHKKISPNRHCRIPLTIPTFFHSSHACDTSFVRNSFHPYGTVHDSVHLFFFFPLIPLPIFFVHIFFWRKKLLLIDSQPWTTRMATYAIHRQSVLYIHEEKVSIHGCCKWQKLKSSTKEKVKGPITLCKKESIARYLICHGKLKQTRSFGKQAKVKLTHGNLFQQSMIFRVSVTYYQQTSSG